jgi:hypothetical protein
MNRFLAYAVQLNCLVEFACEDSGQRRQLASGNRQTEAVAHFVNGGALAG